MRGVLTTSIDACSVGGKVALLQLMGWRKSEKRWVKKYRGRFYYVSARELGCEGTKEGSRVFANAWWEAKRKEVDEQLGQARKHPAPLVEHYQAAMENWRLFAKWHRRYGEPQRAEQAETFMEFLGEALKTDSPPYPLPVEQQKPVDLMEVLTEDWLIWQDRFKQIKREENAETAAPKENSIRAHVDDYLKLKQAQAKAKDKIGTYLSGKQWLYVFRNWVDPFLGVDELNETLWQKYYLFLSGKVAKGAYSPTTAKNYLGAARSFIRNRDEMGFLSRLPRNLNSKQLKFQVHIKDPITFTLAEIKALLDHAKGRTRLYVLLALNCGMYGKDIATLRQDEVNWETGRVSRKRTKTRDRSKNVPKVDYILWRETFQLLKEFRADAGQLALLNANGQPLWKETETADGKWKRDNNVQTQFFKLQGEQMELPKEKRKPWKSLRKTGATLIENSEYGRFSEHYLGEAPSTTASRHYSHKNGSEFDLVIKWLGKQFGLD